MGTKTPPTRSGSLRPEILYPLFAPITDLKGLGPRLAKLAEKVAGPRVVDLLWHLPSGVIDRSYAPSIADAEPGRIATMTVRIEGHQPPVMPHHPYRIRCADGTGVMILVFFHLRGPQLQKLLPMGTQRVISGKLEAFNGVLQMTHPDHVAEAGGLDAPEIEPVYRLTAGLPLKIMRKAVAAAVARAPRMPEWLDPALAERRGWASWRAAIEALHTPQSAEELDPGRPERLRLAYDEMLADQLALGLIRAQTRRMPGRAIAGDHRLRRAVSEALPWALTGAQARALAEIGRDMAAPTRMLRLLQGDVGSGKTIVALMAMLNAVETGAQACLMAPTEILARQHAAVLRRLAEPAGVTIGLLTGRDKGKAREQILEDLAQGRIDIAVGTHALFQESVAFKDLALAVIDEQHRFGVEQRVQLGAKGFRTDILVMTATPIPRSLMLTSYGDLDASVLDEKPPGRKPIETRLIPLDRLDEVADAVGRAIASGTRIYWVCPLVEESEISDLAAAEERHRHLAQRFGARAGLVHGRMKGPERDRVMADFASGALDLLVATTVIEVGVDVPEAAIMVIEHAERFGLAQLHQLRGRIGRGAKASTCLLLFGSPLGETARERLDIMRQTEDGFRIAEADLRLRGAGEVLGTRQSGMPEYRLADLAVHEELLHVAHDDVRLILARDPDLQSPRGKALRVLLYLFGRDEAVRYLRSG